jgi:hypothetical protein
MYSIKNYFLIFELKYNCIFHDINTMLVEGIFIKKLYIYMLLTYLK